jgi:integrase
MRTDYIEKSLYDKLYWKMSYKNALALRVSLETGMRIGDVLKIRKEDIKGRTIHYVAEKTGKSGSVVVSQDLVNRLLDGRSEWCFPHRTKANAHRTRQAVWKDVKKAARALQDDGLLDGRNVAPHSGRKTFAVEDFQKNGLPHTQKVLQHDSKSTTMIYAFADELIGKPPKYDNLELHKILEIVTEIREMITKLMQS